MIFIIQILRKYFPVLFDSSNNNYKDFTILINTVSDDVFIEEDEFEEMINKKRYSV